MRAYRVCFRREKYAFVRSGGHRSLEKPQTSIRSRLGAKVNFLRFVTQFTDGVPGSRHS